MSTNTDRNNKSSKFQHEHLNRTVERPPEEARSLCIMVNNNNKRVRKNFFPYKMMDILADPFFADCIAWRKDGEAFFFLDQDKFAEKIVTISTRSNTQGKKSFIRKLNRWGFKMELKRGSNYGMYSHKFFKRYKPWLCEMMNCDTSNNNRKDTTGAETETLEPPTKRPKAPYEDLPNGVNMKTNINANTNTNKRINMNMNMNMNVDMNMNVNASASMTPYNPLLLEYEISFADDLMREKLHSMRMRALLRENMYASCLNTLSPLIMAPTILQTSAISVPNSTSENIPQQNSLATNNLVFRTNIFSRFS